MSSHASQSVVTDSVVAFLEKIPPFQFLPPGELRSLARSMALEYFPRDTVILSAGHTASEALYIVQKGGVKLALRTKVGKELVIDMRSEGEFFGVLSLMGRDVARLDVVAVEDTLCYSIPAETARELVEKHHEVADYLYRTSLTRYMDRTLHELRTQTNLLGNTEQLLYSLAVREVARKPAVVCTETTTIREAAQRAAALKATSLFVVDDSGQAKGIVTDKDFSRKVVARGISAEQPVTAIMSTPVISIESSSRLFQALMEMLTHNVHHLLVTDDGAPQFVLTSHDLLLLQGKSPLSLARHLEQQTNLEDLAAAQKRIGDLLPLLLREGARASHITRVVAELNDRLMLKILAMAEEQLGPAPVPYCWAVLGSEGRREQTLKTDQDNILIYADHPDEQKQAVEPYFERLADFAQKALEICGYPACPGGFMASNPRWRKPLSGWKETFDRWIHDGELRPTQDALIFFDMRAVAGESSLLEKLRAFVHEHVHEGALFKSVLGFITVEIRPPLGFFRTFVVERSGEHKEELDIKMYGTVPIVNAARLLALDVGLEQTNTVDRLTALRAFGELFDGGLMKDLEESFEFLTLLRLENQLRQARAGEPLSNYISPAKLTHLQRNLLKESFHAITRVQSLIDERFRSAVWQQMGR